MTTTATQARPETTTQQPKCADLVQGHAQERLEDLRILLDPNEDDIELTFEGKAKTPHVMIGEETFEIDDELMERIKVAQAGGRDLSLLMDPAYHPPTDEQIAEEFRTEIWEEIEDEARDTLRNRAYEYGLSFSYVPADEEDGREGYFCYQISWGGPSEEFRFYVGYASTDFYRCEFWYLDWFDGASYNVTDDPRTQQVWDLLSLDGDEEHLRNVAEGD